MKFIIWFEYSFLEKSWCILLIRSSVNKERIQTMWWNGNVIYRHFNIYGCSHDLYTLRICQTQKLKYKNNEDFPQSIRSTPSKLSDFIIFILLLQPM